MLFNEMNSTFGSSDTPVQESPYELGIGGALMHVYENECNYNALMKAAALSEMKYYEETGGDLFVQEAGAFKGFVEKAKDFFKKVIEKIKSIAKKFMAKINQYTMSDKDFVKKYSKQLLTRDLTDFEFDGYEFPMKEGKTENTKYPLVKDITAESDTDRINDIIEKNRGSIVNGSAMTESEFRDELHDAFYGDKDTLSVKIREQLSIISESSKTIKAAEKEERTITKTINNFIKELDKDINKDLKSISLDNEEYKNKAANDNIKLLSNYITVLKAYSNDLTVYFGATTKALADRNRQAKAICVKALSYKHEAATVAEGGYSSLFDGVQIV
jgi:hypothetical protein